jgi:hypothetical protein
MEYNYD